MMQEPKYVDLNQVYEFLLKDCGRLVRKSTLMEYIESCDSTTVREATFGKWEKFKTKNSIQKVRCSRCEFSVDPKDSWRYCPNCGARMEANPDDAD